MANVTKEDIKKQLVTRFKTQADRISVFGLKTKFGGGRSSGFALIYNSVDDKKKYDTTTNLRRVSGPIECRNNLSQLLGSCAISTRSSFSILYQSY